MGRRLWLASVLSLGCAFAPLPAQDPPPAHILFENVRIFDGKGGTLADIKLIEDPGKSLVVIMKSSRIHENTVP